MMALTAKTVKVSSTSKATATPTNSPSTEFTKLNFLNRFNPEGVEAARPTPDVWIKLGASDAVEASVGGDDCIQIPPNIPVEVPRAAYVALITENGGARVNIVGVA